MKEKKKKKKKKSDIPMGLRLPLANEKAAVICQRSYRR